MIYALVVFTCFFIALVLYRPLSGWLLWYDIKLPFTSTAITTVADAVTIKNIEAVSQLIREKKDVNTPDNRGQAPLLIAVSTQQFQIAEVLIDSGANIWAINTLGFNVGLFTYNSQVAEESPEGRAKNRVVEKLQAQGFPWPPPWHDETLKMVEKGNWPPK